MPLLFGWNVRWVGFRNMRIGWASSYAFRLGPIGFDKGYIG